MADRSKVPIEFDAQKIDAIFSEFDQCRFPGAAVGIAIGGRPVYRKGFGLANMDLPVVLSPTMRMRIASTTKHFTALAYLLLCEEGRAGIDDSVGKYLPELHPTSHPVTMRQLMGNVSGLRDVFDIVWQFSGTARPIVSPVSSEQLLSMYRKVDGVNAPPGATWCYNNGGFLILSTVIERITGQSFEDFLRERIFEPIGMYSTLLRRVEGGFLPNYAIPHKKNLAGFYEKSNLNGVAMAGEGGMISTVDDMLQWLIHMNAPVVGSPATWKMMMTPLALTNGTSSGYGFGLMIDRYRGVDVVHHPGAVMGCNAQMLKAPSLGIDVIVILNREDSGVALANKILDACVTGLDPVEEMPASPCATGVFRSPKTGRVVQLYGQDGKQIALLDGFERHVSCDRDGVLWPTGAAKYAKQGITLIGDREQPTSIHFSDFGNADELLRETPPRQTGVERVAGRYRSEAVGVEAVIFSIDGVPRLTTIGQFGSLTYLLECIAEGVWLARRTWISPPAGGILLFDKDNSSFRFSSYRTSALTFLRETPAPAH